MVHALKETWRVSGAHLLDIRPRLGEPQVIVRDRDGRDTICGGLHWNGDDPEGHPHAEAALSRVVAEGLFTVIAEKQFDWIDAFESVDELVESVGEEWESRNLGEEAALKLMRTMETAGRGAVPFIRQPIGIRLLKKVDSALSGTK
jgi:hypothetical protein